LLFFAISLSDSGVVLPGPKQHQAIYRTIMPGEATSGRRAALEAHKYAVAPVTAAWAAVKIMFLGGQPGSYLNEVPRLAPTDGSPSARALSSAKSTTCCDKILSCVSILGEMQLPAASNT
jgi:hypothetical protein